ncbi:hypothetical protein ACFQ7Z_10810 [Streptomyces virginiae]|uniref:hypothetical protein n=1 Tax=Streptomyces virginiae TaxID=1961 RepID=UPI0036C04E5A
MDLPSAEHDDRHDTAGSFGQAVPARPSLPPLPAMPPSADSLAPQPLAVPAARPEAHGLRRAAVGLTTGIAHTVGLTFVFLQIRLNSMGPGRAAKDAADIHLRLAEQGWFNSVGDLAFILTFGEPWPFLWVSVLIAVLVRLNRGGPAKLQLALSVATAFYCLLVCIAWAAVLLQPGWWLLIAMGAAGAFVRLVTRR